MLRLPFAVGPPPFEGGGFEHIMIVREDADVLDADAVGNTHSGSISANSCKIKKYRAKLATI
jgi:hypothetical protein